MQSAIQFSKKLLIFEIYSQSNYSHLLLVLEERLLISRF